MKSKLIYQKALCGAHYFKTDTNNYLIGARTAIHQDLMAIDDLKTMEDKLPDTIFLSDLVLKGNISCQDLEFIFLMSMFLGMDFANGKTNSRLFDFKDKTVVRKLRVVVNKGDENVVWGQLEPSLLGANKGFLKNTCRLSKNLWTMLNDEAHFFNLKNAKGEEYQIEDFVEILYWDENDSIELEGVYVKKEDYHGNFTVVFNDSDDVIVPFVDFNIEDVKPVWEIPKSLSPFSFAEASIIPLGTASPFALDAPPTSYWLKLGERENYLIDCGFFTDLVYEQNGGSLEHLKGIILTHCHGDHFNPIPFLYRSKPIELWTTIENYKLAQKVTCAKAKITPEEFQKRFIHKKIEAMYPGFKAPKYSFGLLDIEFHYSIHPIPTIGLTIYKGNERLLVFSSDMVDLKFMQETLCVQNVVSQARCDMMMERFKQYENDGTLFLLDCGGDGFIHGRSEGYSEFFMDSTKVVECHRGARRVNEKALMQLARPLNLFKIKQYSDETRAAAMLSQLFSNWKIKYFVDLVTSLKDNIQTVELSPGQPVVLEGAKTMNRFYLIEYGNVISSSGLVFSAGEWFGQEALLGEDKYSQSFHSRSATRLIVVDTNQLLKLIALEQNNTEILEHIRYLSQMRLALSSTKIFSDLNFKAREIEALVGKVSVEHFENNALIYQKGTKDDGHLYIILNGTVMVQPNKNKEIYLREYDVIGEAVASGKNSTRNANVYARGNVDLIRMEKSLFLELMQNPDILSRVEEMNIKRAS